MRLLSLLAVTALLSFATLATEEPDPITRQVEKDAYSRAVGLLRAAGYLVPTGLPPGISVTLVPRIETGADFGMPDVRLHGTYEARKTLAPNGRMGLSEEIFLYVPPGDECKISTILTHEYLHAIHLRMIIMDPRMDLPTEFFVRRIFPDSPPDCEDEGAD
jgi:hypothetical protein